MAAPHPDDFALERIATEGPAPTFAGRIPPHWTLDGRAFGGFSAALTLAAVLTDRERPALTSAHVAFLEPGAAGPVEVTVDTRRAGRRADLVHATASQDGRPIILATAWLVDAWADAPDTPLPDPFPPGDTGTDADGPVADPRALRHAPVGPPITWLAEQWPMLAFGERRQVDYPASWAAFRRGRPEVALWTRMVEPLVPFPQLADVVHLDAHLFDAPGQITGFDEVAMLSLDLSIAWQPGSADVPADAWRRIESRGAVAAGGVSSFATVFAEDGRPVAVATSQGFLRR